MAAVSYAEPSDIFGTGGYLRDLNPPANMAVMQIFIAAASRTLDEICGQHFYDDGSYIRYFNGIGGPRIDSSTPFFGSSGTVDAASQGATTLQYTPSVFAPRVPSANEGLVIDVGSLREVVMPSAVGALSSGKYPLTVPATSFAHGAKAVATSFQITIAYFENQPVAQWVLELDGDGWTPPSNWYLWPNIPRRVGSAVDNTAMRPWYGIDLPMIPISNTTWLPTTMIGKATIGVTAHWGWPIVPDLIKDLTCKLAVRLFRRRQTGGGDSGGEGTVGASNVAQLLDPLDLILLKESGLKLTYI